MGVFGLAWYFILLDDLQTERVYKVALGTGMPQIL